MKPWRAAVAALLMLPAAAPAQTVPYDDYATVLTRFVNGAGLVDYAGLQRDRSALDAFTTAIGRLDPAQLASWDEKDRIAFWINAYNALTLRLIVDHYPFPAQAPVAGYPARSIRQIDGAWDTLRFRVLGRDMTLDAIEKNLRSRFHEPRVHMALVCAAMSCPRLRGEPYRGARLDAQLDDQARKFLADPSKFRVDSTHRAVWVSPIFDWFAPDFVPGGAHATARAAVRAFAPAYLDAGGRAALANDDYDVRLLDYDWTLNEQPR
jgi:Protein of unknown function, DUF547